MRWLTLALVSIFGMGLTLAGEAPDGRPNILFCLADDWGWPHAGAYGDPVVRTPAFDRIAAEGALFHQVFVSSPSCTPSRNAILTGQQFYRLGEGGNLWSTLDLRHPTFVRLLAESGYETGHWRKSWGPGDYTTGGYLEHPCGPESTFEAFMENRDPARPFCFWLGTLDPHRGYETGSGAASGMDLDAVPVPPFFPDTPAVRGDLADYYFEVQRWDSDVGQALRILEETGQLDNTVIIMTGDNGIPFPRCKGNLYDRGVRAPFAMRWGDRISPGTVVRDLASFTDIAPTFLEAAGLPVPESMTGQSLLPLVLNEAPAAALGARDFVVYGRERHVPAQGAPSMDGYPSRAIRTDEWLLILNLEPDRWPAGVPAGATYSMDRFADCDEGPTKAEITALGDQNLLYQLSFGKRPAVELYLPAEDPFQTSNLAGKAEYAHVEEDLRRQLEAYLESTADPRFTGAPVRFDDYPYVGKIR